MKTLIPWILTLFSITSAIELAPRSDNPRVVGLDIQRRSVANVAAHDQARRARLFKRQKTVSMTLDDLTSLYLANVTLGTPPQQFSLHIDTGSSDLWVNVANSSWCTSSADNCLGGTYDASASSTYKYVNSNFNITYVDGNGARGNYVTDTLKFGNVQLQNFQFGTGLTAVSYTGVLGIGYAANEAQVVTANSPTYANFPQALLNGGYINRNAYSLWLNDLYADTGSILFGGVDTAKYEGTLVTVPVKKVMGNNYTQFLIAMTSVGYNGSTITSHNLPAPVILDSGSTLSRVPNDIYALISNVTGAVYDREQGLALIYCDYQFSNTYMEFGFSGVNIRVPFSEMILDATDEQGNIPTFPNGKDACVFGIGPSLDIVPILGDTFLRSAYVVYDLERNEVSLAQTVYNATDSNVVEIASGTAPIPSATPAGTTVSNLLFPSATVSAILGTASGSLTATRGNPTGSRVVSSGTLTAGASSSSNGAYPTQLPMVAGAAMMVGAGLLL